MHIQITCTEYSTYTIHNYHICIQLKYTWALLSVVTSLLFTTILTTVLLFLCGLIMFCFLALCSCYSIYNMHFVAGIGKVCTAGVLTTNICFKFTCRNSANSRYCGKHIRIIDVNSAPGVQQVKFLMWLVQFESKKCKDFR